MSTCFIVDNEPFAVEILASYVMDTPGIEVLGIFEDPLLALEQINAGIVPDLIFLDIDMPKLSGVKMAELIIDQIAVIFTTAYPEYAARAFDIKAIDYLLKPIPYERFLQGVGKFEQLKRSGTRPSAGRNCFYVQSGAKGKLVRVKFDDIIYAEMAQRYVHIHLAQQEYKCFMSMENFQKALPQEQFLRVHQSFIINRDRIVSVEKNRVNMENKRTVVIGESYRQGFMEELKKMVIKSRRR